MTEVKLKIIALSIAVFSVLNVLAQQDNPADPVDLVVSNTVLQLKAVLEKQFSQADIHKMITMVAGAKSDRYDADTIGWRHVTSNGYEVTTVIISYANGIPVKCTYLGPVRPSADKVEVHESFKKTLAKFWIHKETLHNAKMGEIIDKYDLSGGFVAYAKLEKLKDDKGRTSIVVQRN